MRALSVARCDGGENDSSLPVRAGDVVGARGFARYVDGCLDFGRLTLSLEVVAACSLRCPGCWVSMARTGMWSAGPGEVMPPGLFDAALSFGRELGASRLTLLGGEPTLHPKLPMLVQSASKVGYQVSVTTNGVCSSRRLDEILSSGLNGISFSLDGSTAQIHDSLRPSANGRSTFHLTLESLRKAVQRRSKFGYMVSVNHTIYPRNLHDAEAMIRLSARLGAEHVRLHFTLPGDFPEPDRRITYIEPERWLALRSRVPDLIRELGVSIAVVQGYGGDAVAAAQKQKSPYLNVQPDGTILLCAAYARLSASEDRSVGRLLSTGRVLLNRLVESSQRAKRQCCGALPRFVRGLPAAVQDVIERAGGLDCIILNGPLLDAAGVAPQKQAANPRSSLK